MNTKIQKEGMETDIMNVHDVARYLRLSESKIYKLAKAGQIPIIRLGRTWRFRKNLIDEWIHKETVEGLQVVEKQSIPKNI